jgi:hypothetical protein
VILKNILGALVLSLLTVGIFLFFRTGAHKSVAIEDSKIPDFQFFYVEHVGPYHEIMPKLTFVEDKFKALDITCPRTFGLFLSDPEKVNHDRLKSQVGCAFSIDETPNLFAPIEGVSETFYPLPITSKDQLSRVKCYKGVFKGSPSLSAIKVYPKIKERASEQGVKLFTPALEVYEQKGSSIETAVYFCGIK